MDKIRLGFIGVGGMGQVAHLRNYATLTDDCEIVALAELRPELGRKVAARYGIPDVYRDHRELLAQANVDALVAIQPFQAHGQLLPELFAAGVPVITEKPLGRSLATGEAIVAAAKARNARLFIAYHKRSDPATMYARRVIDEWKADGTMGRLRYIRIAMPPGHWDAAGFSTLIRSEEAYPPLSFDPAPDEKREQWAQEYDAFVNFYIHQVNLLRHLLGEDYRVAYADPSQVLLVAQSESGVAAALEMAAFRTTLEWREQALIAFEKGYIQLDLPAPLVIDQPGRVTVYSDPGAGQTPQFAFPVLPPVHAMRQQAINFLKAVRGEETCLCAANEALKDLRTAAEYMERKQ